MKRLLAIVFVLALVGSAIVVRHAQVSAPEKKTEVLEPLRVEAAGEKTASRLPADAVVLTLADGASITPPFAMRHDPAAAGGQALTLANGARTRDRRARAQLSLETKNEGTWQAWAHVRWRDSCGNSLTLKVAGQAEQLVGEDSLYNCWHWVEAGKYKLATGKVPLSLIEREDGIAVDQLLFTCDAKYMPVGVISPAGEARAIRRFADDFSHSPGHGHDGWEFPEGLWEISFSFDPNRLPTQYALTGKTSADGKEGIALVKGPAWYGCRLSFSFLPEKDGNYGAIVERDADGKAALRVAFKIAGNKTLLEATGPGIQDSQDVSGSVALNQWHHVVVERWAFVTHVFVDDKLRLMNYAAAPRPGGVGFFVASGNAVFDDVELDEIPWQADDGAELAIPWIIPPGAEWFRTAQAEKALGATVGQHALVGHKGALQARMGDLPLEEALFESVPPPLAKGKAELRADGLVAFGGGEAPVRILRRPEFVAVAPATKDAPVSLGVDGGEARVLRVALRYGERLPKTHTMGPYHFTEPSIPDPSDYLDFTPEEYQKMRSTPEAQKLERRAKFMSIVADWSESRSPWVRDNGAGYWKCRDGVLSASGPAVVRHFEETTGDLEMRLRLRVMDPRSVAEVELYAAPQPGPRVRFSGSKAVAPGPVPAKAASAPPPEPALAFNLPDGNDWHDVVIRAACGTIEVTLDKQPPKSAPLVRGDGGRIQLRVPVGRVDFDDIEMQVPRRGETFGVYSFAQRECDWWRVADNAQWIDHGGITCVLASSWISLSAGEGRGIIWNKREFGPDVLVGFDVEENTDWHGWDQAESHVHYPADNIGVLLTKDIPALSPKGEKSTQEGYRLEVNAENRSATVLYRCGKQVARVAQDQNFPLRYVGGHSPYMPRTQRMYLIKRGGVLRAIVNGVEVLKFEDPEPIAVRRVALGGYSTHVNFSHIEVRQLAAPEPPKPELSETKKVSQGQ
ncbi:MAG TPA: hypothetical protein VGP72_26725 [Planctomycetota bacterium]|jgi:hypothetical protein